MPKVFIRKDKTKYCWINTIVLMYYLRGKKHWIIYVIEEIVNFNERICKSNFDVKKKYVQRVQSKWGKHLIKGRKKS